MLQNLSVLAMLIIGSLEDIKNKQIHIVWIACFALEGVLCCFFLGKQPAISVIIEIMIDMVPGFLLLLLSFVTKGGIGAGDGILLMAAGIFLGTARVCKIFIYAIFLSAMYAWFLFIIKKKGRKHEIPFVPFLLLAFMGDLFV